MLRIGLTGGIGSGKSTVARIFQVLGIPVYYADQRAKCLMNTSESLRESITDLFGRKAYQQGSLNRSYIAGKVFNDENLLAKLNGLVHPVVQMDFIHWSDRHEHYPYVVEEAAILVESGAYKHLDQIVVVFATEETRIARVTVRDGMDENDIRQRMRQQLDSEELKKYSTDIVNNNGDQLLVPQILDLHRKFVSLQI